MGEVVAEVASADEAGEADLEDEGAVVLVAEGVGEVDLGAVGVEDSVVVAVAEDLEGVEVVDAVGMCVGIPYSLPAVCLH